MVEVSSAAQRFTRAEFAEKMLSANDGGWPDMEGLIRDIYVARVNPGRCILDVGVNHGGHFVQMARAVGPTGRVIGFEAVPLLVSRTWESINQHYKDIIGHVTLNNFAVSDTPGTAKFYFSKANDSGLSGLANRPELQAGEIEELVVPVVLVNEYVDQDFIDRLDFAKFDIEGAEYHAFRGASKVLERRPILTFEWDASAPHHFNYKPADLVGLLHSYGYAIYDLFGFHYADVESFTSARVWNFVAVAGDMSPKHVLEPSISTLKQQFPALFS